jgi:hypothetical protein
MFGTRCFNASESGSRLLDEGLVRDRAARRPTKANHDRDLSCSLTRRSSRGSAEDYSRCAARRALRFQAVPALALGGAVPLFVELYAKPKNRGWKESERLLGKFQSLFAKSLVDITRSDIVRILDDIVASGTPYRANRALAALKKLMSWALDRGMIDLNHLGP